MTTGRAVPAAGVPLYLLVQRSVALLTANAPADGVPYIGCFSGGKDSVVIKDLARLAGVPVDWHYHMTTIDPPELLRFIRQSHHDVTWDRPPRGSMFRRIEHKGLPTRFRRWCCGEFKERPEPRGSIRIEGIRVEESTRRAALYTQCVGLRPGRRRVVLPIRLWTKSHVWQYIGERGLPYCSLYDEGFDRLGCVGCPMTTPTQRNAEFARWPGFARQWERSAIRFWERRNSYRKPDGSRWGVNLAFASGEEFWDWWMSGVGIDRWRQTLRQMTFDLDGPATDRGGP